MPGVHGILLGRVASSSAETRGMPERAGEAGPIPDHVELFLRGVTAGAASLSSGEDAAWWPQGHYGRVTTGVSQ